MGRIGGVSTCVLKGEEVELTYQPLRLLNAIDYVVLIALPRMKIKSNIIIGWCSHIRS
ncbi:hypothetical protein BH18THE2_BH18THE2_10790 [soil metagenome]